MTYHVATLHCFLAILAIVWAPLRVESSLYDQKCQVLKHEGITTECQVLKHEGITTECSAGCTVRDPQFDCNTTLLFEAYVKESFLSSFHPKMILPSSLRKISPATKEWYKFKGRLDMLSIMESKTRSNILSLLQPVRNMSILDSEEIDLGRLMQLVSQITSTLSNDEKCHVVKNKKGIITKCSAGCTVRDPQFDCSPIELTKAYTKESTSWWTTLQRSIGPATKEWFKFGGRLEMMSQTSSLPSMFDQQMKKMNS